MAQVELIMPKMGESIIEATILKWVKQVGDRVEIDETIHFLHAKNQTSSSSSKKIYSNVNSALIR